VGSFRGGEGRETGQVEDGRKTGREGFRE